MRVSVQGYAMCLGPGSVDAGVSEPRVIERGLQGLRDSLVKRRKMGIRKSSGP